MRESIDLAPEVVAPGQPHVETSTVPEGPVELACKWLSMAMLAGLVVLIGGEVAIRNAAGFSWEGTDEYGGYLLVAITFFSIPVCLARGGMHEMQILRVRLSPRGVALLNIVLHAVSLAFMLVLVWQFWRLEASSWRSGDASMSGVFTPLWIPRLAMVVGSAAVCFTLVRLIAAEFHRFGRAPSSIEVSSHGA